MVGSRPVVMGVALVPVPAVLVANSENGRVLGWVACRPMGYS